MTPRRFVLALMAALWAVQPSPASAQPASPEATAAEIRTLQTQAAADPGNAPLLERLSQAYAVAGQPEAALSAIEGALALEPRHAGYLRARATLATWAGHYERARDSYRQLAALQPLDTDVTLNYARVSAWAGDTDNAVREYRNYLLARPDAAAVWLELARAQSWRGNYAGALDALDSYHVRFGRSPAYLAELAGVMANSGRPSRAQDVLEPLIAAEPGNYELTLTRTVALARQQRAREAFESLDTLRTVARDPVGVRSAERVLRAELASTAEPRVSMYADSDELQVQRFAPNVTVALRSGTRLSGGYERTRLDAKIGSGLEQVNGSALAEVDHITAGLSQKLGRVSLAAQLGQASVDGRERTTYSAAAQVRPVDTLFLSAERSEGLFVISPRTVGLGLTQVSHRVQAQWAPAMRYHVSFDATHQTLSDGNERTEIVVSPRRAFARRARMNLDMGFSLYRLETTRDLDNGYYDPRRYEYYAFTALPYFKLHENVGLGLTLAAGAQRDSASDSFHFGGTVSGEATFGIYAPWLLKVNSSATLNQRLESGAFRGFGAGVALVRRF